jgi:hypothetical protein
MFDHGGKSEMVRNPVDLIVRNRVGKIVRDKKLPQGARGKIGMLGNERDLTWRGAGQYFPSRTHAGRRPP